MALADPEQDVLVLADGTKVFADRVETPKQQARMVQVPTNREAIELVTNTRYKLADFAETPRKLNALSVVATYSLCGMEDAEISLACGLGPGQLERIRAEPTYEKLRQAVIASILESETDSVRGIFVQHSRRAAQRIVEEVNADGGIGIAAAKEILDRSGHRPADVVEHRHRMDGGLVIEIVRKDDKNTPIIDMDL